MIRVPEQRQHNHFLATCSVFPQSNAAATIFFLLLKLVAITQGRRLLEGSDKNYYCIYDNMNNEKFVPSSSSSYVCCLFGILHCSLVPRPIFR